MIHTHRVLSILNGCSKFLIASCSNNKLIDNVYKMENVLSVMLTEHVCVQLILCLVLAGFIAPTITDCHWPSSSPETSS